VRSSSENIPPLKLTGYLENQTTPGWSNRFQVLFVGGRTIDNEGVSFTPETVESYVVLDYISTIDLGGGELQIGIENLLNNQFAPAGTQALFGDFPAFRPAARGRRLSINYSIDW